MLIEILLAVILVVLIFIRLKSKPRPSNFPPGPAGWPIVGAGPTILRMGSYIGPALARLGEIYGPVCGPRLGFAWTVAVNGPEAVREVLTNDSFAGRPEFAKNVLTGKKEGIMFTEGDFWKVQRRFTLRHLRDWGFGKTSLESVIHDEIEELMLQMEKQLKSSPESVIEIHDLFGISVVNILWAVMAGKRHGHDDEEFKHLLRNINIIFRSGTPLGSFLSRLPILKYIPGSTMQITSKATKELAAFLEASVRQHQNTRDPANPRDFIDEYLHALEDNPDSQKPDPSFSVDQLISTCADLFAAGSESTSNSLAFAILYMILYPQVQEKVREEIESVIGNDRLVSYSDRSRLPYTEAVLTELQRISSIAPITPPHSTVEDTKLGGYSIPKGTFTMVNMWSLHNDKKTWGDPENFRPERFLDSHGKLTGIDRVIPFGLGKRACPGESLARMNLFIFFVTLVQRYRFEVDLSKPTPSTVPLKGFTVAPQPFTSKVIIL